MDDMNVSNYSRAYIGTILPKKSTVNHGHINTEEYKGGIIIKDSVRHKTVFRVIPNDSIFNRQKYFIPSSYERRQRRCSKYFQLCESE